MTTIEELNMFLEQQFPATLGNIVLQQLMRKLATELEASGTERSKP